MPPHADDRADDGRPCPTGRCVREGAAEQHHPGYLVPGLRQLPRRLEGDGPTRAVACDVVGAFRLERADLRDLVRRHLLDRLERREAVEALWLDTVQRLPRVEVCDQRPITEDVAVVTGPGEQRWVLPVGFSGTSERGAARLVSAPAITVRSSCLRATSVLSGRHRGLPAARRI